MKPKCFSSFSKIKPSFDSSHQNSSSLSRIFIDSYYNPYLWFPPNKNPVHGEIGRWYSSQHPVREGMVDDRVRRRKSPPDGDYITISNIRITKPVKSTVCCLCVILWQRRKKRLRTCNKCIYTSNYFPNLRRKMSMDDWKFSYGIGNVLLIKAFFFTNSEA